MGSHRETYIIVGAGIFGTSTALSLQRAKPGAIITLLDQTPFPNPSSASHDLNKIVRAGYADMFSMRLALEAVHFWRNDPFYQKFYHETGMAFIEKKGTGRAIIKNYKALNAASKAEILTLKDARGRFGGVFKDANWEGAEEFFWDPMSGWGEGEALEAVFKTAIARGVRYRKATVTRLMINANGACTGVRTKNDELLIADHVILCTGANTAKLLADTAPTNKNLQVSGRLVAAGAVSCKARVAPENIAHFKKAPVFYNGLVHTHGESIPVTGDGELKLNYEISFTNMTCHEASGQRISVPLQPLSNSTWSQDIPQGLKNKVNNVVWNMYGRNTQDIEIESYRICWDAVTPNQDFIISPHPHCKNLFIATGGSFHAWKFLPIIGKYVVKMLDGSLDEVAARRWAWDRENDGAVCSGNIPKWDLKDVGGYSEWWKEREKRRCNILYKIKSVL